jgi:hypothetical protein
LSPSIKNDEGFWARSGHGVYYRQMALDILAVYPQFIHAMAYNAAELVVLMAAKNLLIVGNNKAYGTLP